MIQIYIDFSYQVAFTTLGIYTEVDTSNSYREHKDRCQKLRNCEFLT